MIILISHHTPPPPPPPGASHGQLSWTIGWITSITKIELLTELRKLFKFDHLNPPPQPFPICNFSWRTPLYTGTLPSRFGYSVYDWCYEPKLVLIVSNSSHQEQMSCYRPQTKFAKVMFLQVSVCPHGGACMVLFGGHAWFYLGGHAWFYLAGGMHGFIRGACMVLFGGHAWFYSGGMCGFIWGGMCGFTGGHAWFYFGGMHGFIRGHAWFYSGGACMVFSFFFGHNEIRSMSGRYASYWNAFLFA